MQKFIQYTPTEILFGENTQAEVGKEVKKWGGSRVFIVYGGGSVKKSGLLAQIGRQLFYHRANALKRKSLLLSLCLANRRFVCSSEDIFITNLVSGI